METVVTLVKPTGDEGQGFHLGNYVSVIKPIRNFLDQKHKVYLGLADAHALNGTPKPEVLADNSRRMIKTLMSFFYDDILNENLIVYRQSMIPETFQLSFMISQFCSKGLMNRMHVYKSIVDDNKANSRDLDWHVNMGLFTYPVLMAADILQFDAHIVPVGQDQLQHIEVAQEIARIANNFFKEDLLVVPKPFIQTETVLPGIDGRKMSKSYNNTIQVFEDDKKLKKLVFSIATNSKNVGEPKFEGESHVTTIYKELATEKEYSNLLSAMEDGVGWAYPKTVLYEKILDIKNKPQRIFNTLTDSQVICTLEIMEEKVREVVEEKVSNIKTALGLLNDE